MDDGDLLEVREDGRGFVAVAADTVRARERRSGRAAECRAASRRSIRSARSPTSLITSSICPSSYSTSARKPAAMHAGSECAPARCGAHREGVAQDALGAHELALQDQRHAVEAFADDAPHGRHLLARAEARRQVGVARAVVVAPEGQRPGQDVRANAGQHRSGRRRELRWHRATAATPPRCRPGAARRRRRSRRSSYRLRRSPSSISDSIRRQVSSVTSVRLLKICAQASDKLEIEPSGGGFDRQAAGPVDQASEHSRIRSKAGHRPRSGPRRDRCRRHRSRAARPRRCGRAR